MMCFLWQHEIYLWYLPGTVCLYSELSPIDLACIWNHLLHACRYCYRGCHQEDTAVGRDRTHCSFSSIRAVVYGLSICAASWLVCDVYPCVYLYFYVTRMIPGIYDFFKRTRMIRTYSSHVVWSKTRMRCDLLYFEVLLLVTGVRADPK